jgi:hypothetical protein
MSLSVLDSLFFVVLGFGALWASWKGQGIRPGIVPPSDAPVTPLSRIGRISLALIGIFAIGRGIFELIQRMH